MQCPVCGNNNPEDAKFCEACGSALPTAAQPNSSANNTQTPPPPNPPFVPPTTSGFGGSVPPKQPHNKKPLIIALSAIAACAVLGLGLFLFLSNPNNQLDSNVAIKSNVVIYNSEKPQFDIVSYDNYVLTISNLANIKEGSVIACPVTDKTPNGLLVKVDSISQVDDGYELHTEQAALTEAIDKCDISKEVAFLADEQTQDIEDADDTTLGFTKAEAAEEGVKAFSYDDGVLKDEAWLSLVTGLKVEAGNIDMKLGIKVHEKTSLSLEKEKDVIDKANDLFEFKKPITVWVGPLPVVLSNTLSVGMPVKLQATASLTQSAETDKVYGFHYTSQDGMQPLESGESESGGPAFINPEGTISATLTFGPKLGFSCELYGVAGPEIEAALENKLEANMTVTTGSLQVENPIIIPGTSVQAYGSIEGSVTVPISGKFTLEIPGFNIFDKSDKPTEMNLFDTKDAITLWNYSLKTEGPVIYDDTVAGQQMGVPIEGVLHVETMQSLATKRYPGESVTFSGTNPNTYIAYIEVSKNVVASIHSLDPNFFGANAYWPKITFQGTIKKGEQIKLFEGAEAASLLQYSGKNIVVTPNIAFDGAEVSIDGQLHIGDTPTGGGGWIIDPQGLIVSTFQKSPYTGFPGTTFKIELVE